MSIEIEYEKRMLVTKNEFLSIKNYLKSKGFPLSMIKQKNHYFEINKVALKCKGLHLRIRKQLSSPCYDLTLKIEDKDKVIELHQQLSKGSFMKMKKSSFFPEGEIKDYLQKHHIDICTIRYYGYLYTNRIEVKIEDYLVVLDKNIYNNIIDYNLEIEAESEYSAQLILNDYINLFSLSMKDKNRSKTSRFFDSL